MLYIIHTSSYMTSDDNSCLGVPFDESNIVQNVGMCCTSTGCYGDMGAVGFHRAFYNAFVHGQIEVSVLDHL